MTNRISRTVTRQIKATKKVEMRGVKRRILPKEEACCAARASGRNRVINFLYFVIFIEKYIINQIF